MKRTVPSVMKRTVPSVMPIMDSVNVVHAAANQEPNRANTVEVENATRKLRRVGSSGVLAGGGAAGLAGGAPAATVVGGATAGGGLAVTAVSSGGVGPDCEALAPSG